MSVRFSLLYTGLFALLAAVRAPVAAQELQVHATPFSVWLDFAEVGKSRAPKTGLPIWIESVAKQQTPARDGSSEKTGFRIRLRRLGSLNAAFQLRVFFFDDPQTRPVVLGWTETGLQSFSSGPLGQELSLPSSAVLVVPGAEVDYLDIEAPGDGSNLRGVFLSSLRKQQTQHAVDFPATTAIEDPFGNLPSTAPGTDDTYLYGRVRATVDAGVLKLTAADGFRAEYGFDLEKPPTLALCTFEVLNADLASPLLLWVNGQFVGPVSPHFPDLADPGYQVEVRQRQTESRVHFAGWLRAQVAIRGAMLVEGLNKIVLGLNEESEPVAVRALELQLKEATRP